MLGNVVAVNINIVTIRIQIVVENKRRVHKRTRVYKTSPLFYLHLLNVEDKTSVENLESDRAFSSKQNDFVVCNLVSQSHIGRHPF